jgi:hypothetical protein
MIDVGKFPDTNWLQVQREGSRASISIRGQAPANANLDFFVNVHPSEEARIWRDDQ